MTRLVTTTQDEKGRDTVYASFSGTMLPWMAPVGRLDKASEGLLLFTNDTEWAARILEPGGKLARNRSAGPIPALKVPLTVDTR